MLGAPHFHCAKDLAAEIEAAVTRMRALMQRSRDLLNASPPDTFLGRPRHALVPLPHQDSKSGPKNPADVERSF
jgi:hypothetical protein